MATQQPGFGVSTILAGADLRTNQFMYVTLNASGLVILASVLGQKVLGVLQNKPNTGEVCDVMAMGVTKLKANAAIAAGADLMSAASGKAATAATTGSTITGKAMSAAAAADEIITATVFPCAGVV